MRFGNRKQEGAPKSAQRKKRVVSWSRYLGAKATAATIAGASSGVMLLAIIGTALGFGIAVMVIFSSGSIWERLGIAALGVGLIGGLSITLGWYALRGLRAAGRVSRVAPATIANVQSMPAEEALLRGSAAPTQVHGVELLRPSSEDSHAADSLLIAVNGTLDFTGEGKDENQTR